MTIAELKSRMSNSELQTWVAYVEENGPLSQSLRLEAAVARAVAPFLKLKPSDLMVWPKPPEQEASINDVLGVLKTAASNSRKH
jgi:hypothetical protein